jgi:peptidoglycan/xylan/chitin deacetylase (PgdA/CDA1 family)
MKSKPILFYHNIGEENFKSFSSTEEFEYQMHFLYNQKLNGVDCDKLNESNSNFGITFDDGYEDNLINALPILKKYNFTATCFIVSNLIGKTNTWDTKQFKLMDKVQIKDWLDAGMYIGSHSLNHLDLTKIKYDQIVDEIADSKKILEDMFAVEINNFCYPFGRFDKNTPKYLKENGYLKAFTTKRGLYQNLINKSFEIPRVPVYKNISKFKFWLKTRTIYENI